jgi:hypothetical protein
LRVRVKIRMGMMIKMRMRMMGELNGVGNGEDDVGVT